MFTCTYLLIVNTSLNLQLRNQQIVVTAGIIVARITDRGCCTERLWWFTSKNCLHARILLIVKTSHNLQLRHSKIVVAAGIIQARITAAVLRDYDGMRVKKMFKCTNFTYCEDIPQFTNTALTNCGRDGSKLAFYLLERH